MQVQKLLKLLGQPAALLQADVPDLEALIQRYPYFYLAHALLAKAAYTEEKDAANDAVQRAATYAIDRTHFRKWLDNKLPALPIVSNTNAKATQEPSATINNYLETIAKKSLQKSTNENSVKQFSIIDNILNKNLQFDPCIEVVPLHDEATVDLSAQGTTLDDRFATETLARIMVQQKKYKRAIEIYSHLMSKHPEKKSYIEGIISSLNSNL
ncbi:MAG: hypothetical protein NMK33_05055 [Candidatus Cardinium sp.]|uniref:hypothetical protein n=1 Tax=Cardinium endosymbiont of Dermatophagoides farinae TaxID=2597823 RepID=UPI0011835BD8|nr:hypothetical protein [Cardinium endosymbiont of Dermatophagoides farinae]TSJ80787.1 hypothetical protein FPG78_01840 [Cardinium endosymbiont of Dermatophagoides farinae]UWW96790.1 MAG: hypothetical protein NMK33_05055 [Candidatus Cardinium sp.]